MFIFTYNNNRYHKFCEIYFTDWGKLPRQEITIKPPEEEKARQLVMINNMHAKTQLKHCTTNPFSLTTSESALSRSIIACAELEFRFTSGPISIISKRWTPSLNS